MPNLRPPPVIRVNAAAPDYDATRERSYSREEIAACADVATLSEWFVATDARELQMRAFIDAFRAAAIGDEAWFRRTAGALAYCSMCKKQIERRILLLGGEPPYFPTDPRSRELRILSDKLARMHKRVAELEREIALGKGEA